MVALVAQVALALCASGCARTTYVWEIEFGHGDAPPFRPIEDGDAVEVVLGPTGVDMVIVSVRLRVGDPGTDPTEWPIDATAQTGGLVVARGYFEAPRWTAEAPGVFVTAYYRIVFRVPACCFLCAPDGTLRVRIGEADSGPVPVIFQRTTCPDPGECCDRDHADECPNPESAARCDTT